MQIFLEFVVADVDRFRAAFSQAGQLFATHGARSATLFCYSDLGNRVGILTDWPSIEDWEAFLADADVRCAIRLAGVVGKVRYALPDGEPQRAAAEPA